MFRPHSKIEINEEGQYSLLSEYGHILVPYGQYDLIEYLGSREYNSYYKVKINRIFYQSIDFGTKYGIIDDDGKIVLPLIYDDIQKEESDINLYWGEKKIIVSVYNIHSNEAIMDSNSMEQVISFFSSDGVCFNVPKVKEIIEKYEAAKIINIKTQDYKYKPDVLIVGFISDGVICGAMDGNGNMIVPCKYRNIRNISYNGMSEFIQKGESYNIEYYGYGNILDGFSEDCSLLLKNKKDGFYYFTQGNKNYIYNQGYKIFETENVEELGDIMENYISFKKGAKWGLLDFKNNVIIEPEYEWPLKLKNGYIEAKKDKNWGLIDLEGKIIIDFSYQILYHEEFLIRCQDSSGKWGVLDYNNQIVIPFIYKELFEISEGLIGFLSDDNKIGFINRANKIIIPSIYDGEYQVEGRYRGIPPIFKDGLAPVNNGKGYGFINHQGKGIIPFKYDETWGFENNSAYCSESSENNGYGYYRYRYDVLLNGTEILKEEDFNETHNYDSVDGYNDYGYSNGHDDIMDAYEGDPDALWNTD